MTNPRDFAFRILRRWGVVEEPPFLPERGDAVWGELQEQHRAAAFELLTGVTRWRGALDAVIAGRLRQPLETLDVPVRAALWLGAYQILFQETADYAAVDTTVSLIRTVQPAAGGLVNAVLRGVTRLLPRRMETRNMPAAERLSRRGLEIYFQSRLFFNADIFPDPLKATAAHLAAVRSHPRAFVEALRQQFDDATVAAILLRNNLRPVITFRVDADALDVPALAGLAAHASAERFLVAAQGWNDAIEGLVAKGKLSPQDPTAAKPVRQAAALAAVDGGIQPKRILDLCAGLGTKTIQLARAFPNAAVVATDTDGEKLKRLAGRAKQIGVKNVETLDLAQLESQNSGGAKIENRFDLILVDVPCSNTGVMARRVQSRWRWPTLDHAELAKLQHKLIGQAVGLAAAGGTVIYSTCSILRQENQERVGKALEEMEGVTLLAEEATLPSLDTPPAGMFDGGYFAVVRVGNE